MERFLMNTDSLNSIVSQIGCLLDGTFVEGEECAETLEELTKILQHEDRQTRHIRRHLGILQIFQKALAPLLIQLDEDNHDDKTKIIFKHAIRLMADLTQPLDCLVSCPEEAHALTKQALQEIDQLTVSAVDAFCDPRLIRAMLTFVDKLMGKSDKTGSIIPEDCDTINDCLFLFRNLLFLPGADIQENFKPKPYVVILSLLFQYGLKDILLNLLRAEQGEYWCVSMVQLISLMYKDQVHETNERESKHPTLSTADLTGSDHLVSINSEEEIKCEQPTYDNNDQNTKDSSSPEMSQDGSSTEKGSNRSGSTVYCANCGKTEGSHENCSGNTTSAGSSSDQQDSQDSDSHSASTHLQELEIKVATRLLAWQLGEKLSDFTYAFLEKGFGKLVKSVKTNLLSGNKYRLSDLYFLWLIGHFLKISKQVGIPFAHIKESLSVDVIGFLVFTGAVSCETLLLAQKQKKDISGAVRHNYLVVNAIRQVLTTVYYYLEIEGLTEGEKKQLDNIQTCIIGLQDLRMLLLMLIRHHQPDLHSIHYLQEVVTTNHQFLLIAEKVFPRQKSGHKFNMLAHIDLFATAEVMWHYGQLLQNFKRNNPSVNDCVFTMMHHVAGDCGKPDALLQLPILRMFTKIWDMPQQGGLTSECVDLIQFVIERFMTMAETDTKCFAELLFQGLDKPDPDKDVESDKESGGDPASQTDWSSEEIDELFLSFSMLEDKPDQIQVIVTDLNNKGFKRSKLDVMVQLAWQGLWTQSQLESALADTKEEYFAMEEGSKSQDSGEPSSPDEDQSDSDCDDSCSLSPDVIPHCVEFLNKRNEGRHLRWLQTVLVETCYVKLGGREINERHQPEEPIPLHYTLLKKSVPLIPFTLDQEKILKDHHFSLLIQSLGFHTAGDTGQIYPRIPHFWSPDDLLFKAEQLGEVNFAHLKFERQDVVKCTADGLSPLPYTMPDTGNEKEDMDITEKLNDNPMSGLWHMFVYKCNLHNDHSKMEMTNSS